MLGPSNVPDSDPQFDKLREDYIELHSSLIAIRGMCIAHDDHKINTVTLIKLINAKIFDTLIGDEL